MITFDSFNPSWQGISWFNLGGPCFKIGGRFVWLWDCFNRQCSDGSHFWGIGVLHVGSRHLFYVGHNGVSLLFVGRTA